MISTIKDMNGIMVSSFKEKTKAGEKFFKNLFKEPEGFIILEILKVINLFPKLITEEMNNFLRKEDTEEEMEKTIYSIHKGKSLGPDGFNIEFFQGSFDLVKEDLLKVVKESQRARKVLGDSMKMGNTFWPNLAMKT